MITMIVAASSVVDLSRLEDEARKAGLSCASVTTPDNARIGPMPEGERCLAITSDRFTPLAEAFRMAGVKARE